MSVLMGDGAFNINYINIKEKEVVLGVNDEENAAQVKVFPNPASDKITIELAEDVNRNTVMRLYDSAGVMIRKQKLVARKTDLSTDHVKPGLYLLQIRLKDETVTRKIMIK
jgi:hypothetical protein